MEVTREIELDAGPEDVWAALTDEAQLEEWFANEVEVDGETVIGPGPDRGMVFQGYSLYPWRTVWENIAFGLDCAGVPRRDRPERIAHYAQLLIREIELVNEAIGRLC